MSKRKPGKARLQETLLSEQSVAELEALAKAIGARLDAATREFEEASDEADDRLQAVTRKNDSVLVPMEREIERLSDVHRHIVDALMYSKNIGGITDDLYDEDVDEDGDEDEDESDDDQW